MRELFEAVELENLTTRNRLVRSATWEGIALPDGSLPDEAFEIYSRLARGGVGAIFTGFTSVATHDRYFEGMMRLSDDALIGQYRRLVDVIHAEGCPVITQLALGAFPREVLDGWVPVEPDDMTRDEIRMAIGQFVDAAVRADAAGFDGVQIHAAHFFFLSRFISPAANHRGDDFGGTLENRARILLEILDGIRWAAPSLHVSVKIHCSDFVPGGLDADQCLAICKMLDEAGIGSIEVSGNGTSVAGIKAHVSEGYFVPAAARIAEAVLCPVIVVGGLRSADTMEAVVQTTGIELVSLSRPLLREPGLPMRMMADPSYASACVSCNRCYSSVSHRCVFRGRD